MALVTNVENTVQGEILITLPMVELHKIVGQDKKLLTKGTMDVILVEQDGGDVCFLSIQSYQAPIIPSVPCLCVSNRQYVFALPDCVFYGITVPKYLAEQMVNKFEEILLYYGNLRKKPTPVAAQQPSGGVMAATLNGAGVVLEKTSQFLAFTVVKSAAILGRAVSGSGHFLQRKMSPNERPKEISENTVESVKRVRKFTGSAVQLSAQMVDAASQLAKQAGGFVASTVSATPLGKAVGNQQGPATRAAKGMAKAGVTAVTNVYDALYDAGEVLLRTTTETTAQVVQHKYGNQAGDVTREALGTVCDVGLTVRNVGSLGPKMLALQTATETTKNLALPGSNVALLTDGSASATAPAPSSPHRVIEVTEPAELSAPTNTTSEHEDTENIDIDIDDPALSGRDKLD